MDIILDKPEQMLFALLRSALNSTKPVSEILFTDISPALWQACYKLACTQGVMALAWDGIQTLPACLQPPKALKLNWAMAVEKSVQLFHDSSSFEILSAAKLSRVSGAVSG